MKKHVRKTRRKPKPLRRRSGAPGFYVGLLLLVLLSATLARCASRRRAAISPATNVYGLEIPRIADEQFLIFCDEGRYTLLYDTLARQAAWAAYVLTRGDLERGTAERRNRFVVCPEVRRKGWPYARESDYTGTGYDRGHLVPSADRGRSQAENDATFRMSNIAPQTPRLNRVVWNHLEAEIRRMAQRFDTLRIVTGGLQSDTLRLGGSRVAVPARFFKVVLARIDGRFRAIGFVIPNTTEINGTFRDYAVSVDSVERLTGFDFFPGLPEPSQTRIESECRLEIWK